MVSVCVCIPVNFKIFSSYTAERLLCSKHELLRIIGEVANYVA